LLQETEFGLMKLRPTKKEEPMNRQDCIEIIRRTVNEKIQGLLETESVLDVASLDWVQGLAQEVSREVSLCVFAAWRKVLEWMAQEMRVCPRCGRPRKCKWRSDEPLRIDVLGLSFELPKLYLECDHCDAPGVSIIKLLTGLRCGDASLELKLLAGYCASQHSYQKASRDLSVHHHQELERTKVRRMALEVEQAAIEFAEQSRRESLSKVGGEMRTHGPPVLILEADGGKVRTGEMKACEPGDAGFGKVSPKRGKPCRKRPTGYREIITMDVREPGEKQASALDVLVPVLSEDGERSRRMLALAARKGLSDNTQVQGLGDMGSGLSASFDEAFVGYDSHWSADWKHTRDYVDAASAVLRSVDEEEWSQKMRDAIWNRDESARNKLLSEAQRHRAKKLPAGLEKCPVRALRTYLTNNWKHMEFARLEREGLPIVSARAESQVRDLTKDRFCVAGAWLDKNLEPKAVLRTIITEGRWEEFRQEQMLKSTSIFERELLERLEKAIGEGRLNREQVCKITSEPMMVAA